MPKIVGKGDGGRSISVTCRNTHGISRKKAMQNNVYNMNILVKIYNSFTSSEKFIYKMGGDGPDPPGRSSGSQVLWLYR